jgi:hypothetical protein
MAEVPVPDCLPFILTSAGNSPYRMQVAGRILFRFDFGMVFIFVFPEFFAAEEPQRAEGAQRRILCKFPGIRISER